MRSRATWTTSGRSASGEGMPTTLPARMCAPVTAALRWRGLRGPLGVELLHDVVVRLLDGLPQLLVVVRVDRLGDPLVGSRKCLLDVVGPLVVDDRNERRCAGREVFVDVVAELLLVATLLDLAEDRPDAGADGSRREQWRREEPDDDARSGAPGRAMTDRLVAVLLDLDLPGLVAVQHDGADDLIAAGILAASDLLV